MSSHRVMKDLFKAFTDVGPGVLADPGDAGTITVDMYGQTCEMTSTTAETRTLARPDRPGIPFTLRLYTDGGTVTVTVTGGINATGDTVIAFADAGDFVQFISVQASASTYRWQVVPGTAITPTVEVTSASPSASGSSSPSASTSASPSASTSASTSSSPSST